MKKKYSISAIIIARNEESTIHKVVMESVKILPKLTNKFEILVNDDASSDKTPEIIDQLSKKYRFIKVFHQKKPLGIRNGLEFLYKKAGNDLIFTNSGDGQYTIKDLPKMLNKLNEGYDLVVGKRKNKADYSALRESISFIFNFLPGILFGIKLYDAGSNKLYKRQVLKNTLPKSKSVFSEAERIIRAYKLGYKVTFTEISYIPRVKGASSVIKPKIILNSFLDMLKLFYNLNLSKLFR